MKTVYKEKNRENKRKNRMKNKMKNKKKIDEIWKMVGILNLEF